MVLLCCPALATAETLPSLVQITGLKGGDILNVRAAPAARAEDLGDLSAGATVEVLEYSPDGKWAQILWNDANGWISSGYVTEVPRPRLESGLPVGLTCNGTEPFWSLELLASGDVEFRSTEISISGQINWSTTSVNSGDTRHAFGNEGSTGVLQRAICDDAMSDRIYGWSLDLVLRGEYPSLLSGCCTAN